MSETDRLTSALILIEETETQSRNMMLRGTAEDQSSPSASSLPRAQNRVPRQACVPPALTDEGREKDNTCESGCSPAHTPKPSPEGPSGPQGTNPVPSLTSLIPPVCLYSADTFDPFDHLAKTHQISTVSQHCALNIHTRERNCRLAHGAQDGKTTWK